MKPLRQAKGKEVGKYLGAEMLDHMSEEQLIQLYELHKAASGETDTTDTVSDRKQWWFN